MTVSARIYGFFGAYHFLSNFHEGYPVVIDGIEYATNEHAFAAAKTHDRAIKLRIAAAATARSAKQLGRNVKLRTDWEAVKDGIMLELVRLKFATHQELAAMLMDTDDAELVEANHWHDTYWGVDYKSGKGRNQLGKTHMLVRSERGF